MFQDIISQIRTKKLEIFFLIIGVITGFIGSLIGILILKRQKKSIEYINQFSKFAIIGSCIAIIPTFFIGYNFREQLFDYQEILDTTSSAASSEVNELSPITNPSSNIEIEILDHTIREEVSDLELNVPAITVPKYETN